MSDKLGFIYAELYKHSAIAMHKHIKLNQNTEVTTYQRYNLRIV